MDEKKEKLIIIFLYTKKMLFAIAPYSDKNEGDNKVFAIDKFHQEFKFDMDKYNDCGKVNKNLYQDLYNHIVSINPKKKVIVLKKIKWKKYNKHAKGLNK